MKSLLRSVLVLAVAAAVSFGCATPGVGGDSPFLTSSATLKTVSLIVGEPNFSVDGAFQELQEGLYTRPQLRKDLVLAPLDDLIPYLGGSYLFDAETDELRLSLAGRQLLLKVGSTQAEADQLQEFTLTVAPELKDGVLWLPVADIWKQLGAYVKWDKTRQRLTGAFILPPSRNLEDFARGGPVTEATMGTQPAAFYAGPEGRRLADVIVGYQNADGGWPKVERDVNLLVPVNTAAMTGFRIKSTIDNDSTMKQMAVLARVHAATQDARYAESFLRGLDYVLLAQLPNGGWQQFWPDPQGYKAHITFNDDTIANVLEVLRDIVSGEPIYAFVDPGRVARARAAYDRGISLILKTQIVVTGRKTGWCSQYDHLTLEPRMGRAFKLPSISGAESVNVVRFLMSIDQPSPEIVAAVQDAVAWFNKARMDGIKLERVEDSSLEFGFDRRVVTDPKAPSIWARFYDLESGKPLFSARDGVKRDNYGDVSYERRVKYSWFATEPRKLLAEYPAWQVKWAPKRSVLR
ncbi:MAG: pectate lyase [Candidatus Dactylopiibacterium carminicum]|nr:pectate lyase [Candidatus Dactylopiibacterium carminicum]PAS98534.1 MAG: pectate lyase [Candidatus Dactylopiibacterium carminicum]